LDDDRGAGARLFYVIQKRDEFFTEASLQETILDMVNMTKGGLVVYGSLIGGTLAALIYLKIHKLPVLKIADLMAPGMVLGLTIGRLGCLMNGCCYGGVCDAPLPNVTFPPGSAPYMQQLSQGDLIGIKATPSADATSDYALKIDSVAPGSIAAELNLEVADEVTLHLPPGGSSLIEFQFANPDVEFEEGKQLAIIVDSKQKGRLALPFEQLPTRSRGTHPTQIYSSINAGLLCLVLWFFWTIKKSDGEVFALNRVYDFPMGKCLGNPCRFCAFCVGAFLGRGPKFGSARSGDRLTISQANDRSWKRGWGFLIVPPPATLRHLHLCLLLSRLSPAQGLVQSLTKPSFFVDGGGSNVTMIPSPELNPSQSSNCIASTVTRLIIGLVILSRLDSLTNLLWHFFLWHFYYTAHEPIQN